VKCNFVSLEVGLARTSLSDSAHLDRYDLAILRILQRDNTTRQRAIGKAIHLSAAAVQRRIKRLQENGTIHSNVAIVEPTRVGYPITIIVDVELHNERGDLYDAAKKRFQAAPEVQQCYDVTGETDFVLIILVRSMREYKTLTHRLFFKNKNVKSVRTLVVMDRVKAGLTVPLSSERAE
jgi:Lrp/AsnC family transcriptional regulator, leucine-responsive regulatory protein